MIIMDILMPVMGGYDATKEIRKIEDQYKVAREDRHFICGFSADVSAGKINVKQLDVHIVTTQKCKEAGMNHILPKPMDNHILKELVEKYKRPSVLMKTSQP
jgi:CheY-like chemotaxis protein